MNVCEMIITRISAICQSCLKEDKEEKGRATQTSGIMVKAGGRKIALYLSWRRHAGENLAELIVKRDEGLGRPIQMSGALAANTSVEKNVIPAYCLAHARNSADEITDVNLRLNR